MTTIRLLSENDVRSVGLSLDESLRLTEQAYCLDADGRVEVPTKIGVHPDYPGSFLHAMPAWADGTRALGMKWVSYFPGNFNRGLADSTGIIILNDPDHGHPVCIMEGMYVTFLRTAACAAVAVRALIRRDPETLLLVGCGGLGKWSLRVMAAAFPSLRTVYVSSRRAETRERFAADMAGEGPISVVAVEDIRDVGPESDIVVSSVPPSEARPVTADCLAPGSFYVPLDLTNAWHDDVPKRMDRIFADDPPNLANQFERVRPEAGLQRSRILRTQDIFAGKIVRSEPESRTLVGVCGIASTDVMIGWEVFRRAVAEGRGTLFKIA